MYFNDVHILYYVLFGGIGALLGQFIDYCSKAFMKEKKIFRRETLKEYKRCGLSGDYAKLVTEVEHRVEGSRNKSYIEPNYILIVAMILSYVALIYKFGIYADITKNIDLIKYMILIPMLFCAFQVDLKEQIIPNRLNLTMFEIGLIFVFISGLSNINIAINMLLGMLAGGGIFLIITLVGGLIAGKEAMGLRRCKINGSLTDYILD